MLFYEVKMSLEYKPQMHPLPAKTNVALSHLIHKWSTETILKEKFIQLNSIDEKGWIFLGTKREYIQLILT